MSCFYVVCQIGVPGRESAQLPRTGTSNSARAAERAERGEAAWLRERKLVSQRGGCDLDIIMCLGFSFLLTFGAVFMFLNAFVVFVTFGLFVVDVCMGAKVLCLTRVLVLLLYCWVQSDLRWDVFVFDVMHRFVSVA